MSEHRGAGTGITAPQIGLSLVALAVLAVAVLIGQRSSSSGGDEVGASIPSPSVSVSAAVAPLDHPGAGASSAPGGKIGGSVSGSPSPGRVDRVAEVDSETRTVAGAEGTGSSVGTGTAGRAAPATPAKPGRTPRPPASHRPDNDLGLDLPPVPLPSCVVNC